MKKAIVIFSLLAAVLTMSAQRSYFTVAGRVSKGGFLINKDCAYDLNNGIDASFGFEILSYFKHSRSGFLIGLDISHAGGVFYLKDASLLGSGTMPMTNGLGVVNDVPVQLTAKVPTFKEDYDFWYFNVPIEYIYRHKSVFVRAGVDLILPVSLKTKEDWKEYDLCMGPELTGVGVTLDEPMYMETCGKVTATNTLYKLGGSNNFVNPMFVDGMFEIGCLLPISEKHRLVVAYYFEHSFNKVEVPGGYNMFERTNNGTVYNSLMQTDEVTTLSHMRMGLKMQYAFAKIRKEPRNTTAEFIPSL
ncbi:MAG: hypothetical protein J6X62_03215 [Bacteroidales bacterium]|nr:hypothetical protein [Bacteroidales bacterium]